MSTKIGIYGYGNLAKGVECAIMQNPDMCLTSVFTRRQPETVKVMTEGVSVYHTDDILNHKDEIDVLGNNITNVKTPGYKTDRVETSAFEME